MNLLSETATKTFNLLSIGQRGVGKTVFLGGSYTELHENSQTERSTQLWFDCQDSDVQENIERLLGYVVQTGQYPPPTMRITNFSFSLKRHISGGDQTLCHFRWWDIPGEICSVDNSDFRRIVSTSHGCCVFIDAYALVHDNTYLQEVLGDIIRQVKAIASLVTLNDLKYAFAVILTKCDLLEPSPLSHQQIEQSLQPLTTRLDAARANYQTFYSFIPIDHTKGASTLNAKGAAAPLLWLVCELNKVDNPSLVPRLLPNGFQPRLEGVDGTLQSLFTPPDKVLKVKKIFGLYLLPSARRNLLLLALAIIGLLLASGLSLVGYKWFLRSDPQNLPTLQQRGQ